MKVDFLCARERSERAPKHHAVFKRQERSSIRGYKCYYLIDMYRQNVISRLTNGQGANIPILLDPFYFIVLAWISSPFEIYTEVICLTNIAFLKPFSMPVWLQFHWFRFYILVFNKNFPFFYLCHTIMTDNLSVKKKRL